MNIEKKPGTDDRYMIMNVVKRRRVDSMAGELSNITYLAHPFHKTNGLRLIDDMNLDKVLSLQTLTTDVDEVVPKEKLNAVPRESKVLPMLSHSLEDDDDIF